MYDAQKKQSLETARLKDQQKRKEEAALFKNQEKNKQEKSSKTLGTNKVSKNARKAKGVLKKEAKNLAKSATPWGAFSLLLQVRLSDAPYFFALLAAVLKDIVDLIELTGVGYILVLITTLLISIFIGFMMILAGFSDGGGQRMKRKMARRWIILASGAISELLIGIGILPIETLSVLLIFFLALADRKENKKNM